MNGVYWGVTPLHLMNHAEALPRDETIEFVLSCQHENGGFGAAPLHDAHMLYTVSAIQILATLDALDELDRSGRGGKQRAASCMRTPSTNPRCKNTKATKNYSHSVFTRPRNRSLQRR
jgi:prenyltransferase beta subunit